MELKGCADQSGGGWWTAKGYMKYPLGLPIKHRGEELGDETFVIWAERLCIDWLVAFAVQVVRVERAYCGERTLVLFICEV
jgi:hypothetical protein